MIKKKDMSKLHNLPKFSQVVKRKSGVITNYANQGLVDVKWGWNDAASLDQIIGLRVNIDEKDFNRGYKEIFIDWQELYHYARGVSLSFEETKQRIQEEQRARR